METIFHFLPKSIASHIGQIPPNQKDELEEIRVRINRPIEITVSGCPPCFLPYIVNLKVGS